MKTPQFLRKLAAIFDKPKFPASLPQPKSPLRLQFETEWSEAVNSAGRALCLAVLGTISGMMLSLTAMLCFGERRHAALAKHLAQADFQRMNRALIDRTHAHFENDILKRQLPSGWEKERLYERGL